MTKKKNHTKANKKNKPFFQNLPLEVLKKNKRRKSWQDKKSH